MVLLEYTESFTPTPGVDYLIIDHCSDGIQLELMEGVDNGLTRFRGKFQEADAVNKNKRSYPFSVLDENVRKLEKSMKERSLMGELDHPTDSIVHLNNVSHIVTKLWWEDKVLMGEGVILNTPSGKVLKALINDGVKIGISSRGVGNGKMNESGVLVISEGYKLITFDVVADPSTYDAYQQKVVSRKTESKKSEEISQKNESTRIDTITKEAVIAVFGSLLNSNVTEIKKRLK